MIIDNNIKSIRKKWRMQQGEFAELMGVNRLNISSYEIGKNEPKTPFLLELQRLTGINAADIYYRVLDKSEIPSSPLENVSVSDIKMKLVVEYDDYYYLPFLIDKIKSLEKDIELLKSERKKNI